MVLGYQSPLYVMAFDQRGSFERDLFGAKPPLRPEVRAGATDAKKIIYEGFVRAVEAGAPREAAGVLVDEEFGADVARAAKAAGFLLAMPVEKSGQAEFDFSYGEDFGAHIEAFDPNFTKVLVRYNPEGDRDLNARQSERLARLSTWVHERDRKFLFELLVPATGEQLEGCGGDNGRFDRELRPGLVVRTIASLQDSGVNPDIWKIEGLETANDCIRVGAQARTGGRGGVGCIILGRGAELKKVTEWLEIAAGVPGFIGFAVGRTVWEDALRAYLAGTVTRDQAAATIADRYRGLVDTYVTTARAGVVSTPEPS
jgi:myo-inositol catabolism protein IolC